MAKEHLSLIQLGGLLALLLNCASLCGGFVTPAHVVGAKKCPALSPCLLRARKKKSNDEDSFLMDDYRDPTTGEVMDPYEVLKLERDADRQTIKAAYRTESRRYHPDVVMHKKILPGRCNNLDEVRDQWERVKLSYEILYDPKSRKRYDRHWALADPGRAVKRAASQAAVEAAVSVGKGLWGLGSTMVRGAAVAASKAKYEYKKNKRLKTRRLTSESTRLIKRTKQLDNEQRRRYLELEVRARIDDSLQAGPSVTNRSSLFSKSKEKNARPASSLNAANSDNSTSELKSF